MLHIFSAVIYPVTGQSHWVLTDDWDAKFLSLEVEKRDNSNVVKKIKPSDRCPQLTQDSKSTISAALDPMYRAKSDSTTPTWMTPNEFNGSPKTTKLLYCFALSQKAMV